MEHPDPYDRQAVVDLISAPRFAAYLNAAESTATALDLYEWNASMASALFELVGHVEVILRNAIDSALQDSLSEDERRIPWFMLSLPKIQAQLSPLDYDDLTLDRDRALSTLTMGYWANLVRSPQLWENMSGAFLAECAHETLVQRTDRAHRLRNRLAHHASMLDVDVHAEVQNLLALAGLVSPDAQRWLMHVERATAVIAERPVKVPDTVLIPASAAWPVYQKVAAYVCQVGRNFRAVDHLAFYFEGEIQAEVPKILDHREKVSWTEEEATRLAAGNKFDRQLANAINLTRKSGWDAEAYQVFLLTRPSSATGGHRTLPHKIPHQRTGRGSAFVQKQRYFHYNDLTAAKTTDDLPRSYFFADPLPSTSDDAASAEVQPMPVADGL
ncbi:hypothetical protein [Cellulosimicrobium cellulans]|uniref:hypothetical protein n=1 Tax=Cellulosimicrobium cellulans TaxID=1710 RepID=UPI003C68F26C